jgi:prepilin-type N-terminal cleavage/methylation domain-containing protein
MDLPRERQLRRLRPLQAGFTLMELMITVAIVGILAAVALPVFTGESRKAKGDSEVAAFFGEFVVREEQYAVENGRYLSTGASESAIYPASPGTAPQSLASLPTTWQTLKIRTPESTARCGYVVVAGTRTDTAGAMATGSFGFTTPARNWFYVLARCNLDGDSAADSYYFTSSLDAKIQKLNYGK